MRTTNVTERRNLYTTATLVFGPGAVVALGALLLGIGGWRELLGMAGALAMLVYARFAAPGSLLDRRPWIVPVVVIACAGIALSDWYR